MVVYRALTAASAEVRLCDLEWLEATESELRGLDVCGQGKTRGRAAQQMGLHFLLALKGGAATRCTFHEVGEYVGNALRSTTAPRLRDFAEECRRLPLVGNYHAVRFARFFS